MALTMQTKFQRPIQHQGVLTLIELISVFTFKWLEEATANFNTSNGDPRKKPKLREYYTNMKPFDNEAPVIPSATQKVLVGNASTVHENCHNSELPWLNKVRDVIGKDCNIDKFSNTWAAFFSSNEQQVKRKLWEVKINLFYQECSCFYHWWWCFYH